MRLLTISTQATLWLGSVLAFPSQVPREEPHGRSNKISLERRTTQPPGRGLSLEVYWRWTNEAEQGLSEACRQDRALWPKIRETLGIKPQTRPTPIPPHELNDALKQVDYPGPPFPEEQELTEAGREEMQEQAGENQEVSGAIQRALHTDRAFDEKVRRALGIVSREPWRALIATTPQRANEALRRAGWPGPFYPEGRRAESEGEGAKEGGEGSSAPVSGAPETPGHPQSSSNFLSNTVQSLSGVVGKKFSDVMGKMPHLTGSPSPLRPLFPATGPLLPLSPIW
ncbi:MAG: hypothetical protein M1816_006736 [Peltula sp. TS41687]|nr:MAG: hypothetical protein M1816_006736 [Peltula sp. TS41687]